jgi:hypothetical protein
VNFFVVQDAGRIMGRMDFIEVVKLVAFLVAIVGIGEGRQVGAVVVLYLALEADFSNVS